MSFWYSNTALFMPPKMRLDLPPYSMNKSKQKLTGYRDERGHPIHDGDKVSAWLTAPWDEEQVIERFFIVRKEGRRWFCDGVESNDENDFLKEFKNLEVVK